MTPPILFAHPFSSYCQKALIALWANGTPFEMRLLEDAESWGVLEAIWPIKKMPVLVDGERTVAEATIIIEYLHLHHPGPVPMLPADLDAALTVRQFDRIFDNYVMDPMGVIVADRMREAGDSDTARIAAARKTLDTAYAWLDDAVGATWAVGDVPSLADCAAAPSSFYADWVHPIADAHARLKAYRARLLAWPPYARAVDAARPYRAIFPGGAPDRD